MKTVHRNLFPESYAWEYSLLHKRQNDENRKEKKKKEERK